MKTRLLLSFVALFGILLVSFFRTNGQRSAIAQESVRSAASITDTFKIDGLQGVWMHSAIVGDDKDVIHKEQSELQSNRMIAYLFEGDLWTILENGTDRTNLTNIGLVTTFTWSPDGQQIAYIARTANWNAADIYVVNADGSNQRRLTNNTLISKNVIDWNRDRIAFIYSTGSWKAKVAYIDVTDPHKTIVNISPEITNDPLDGIFKIRWSPNGQWVAFSQGTVKGVVSADGNIFYPSSRLPRFYEPEWKNDSTNVIYIDYEKGIKSFDPNNNIDSLLSSQKAWCAIYSPDDAYLAYTDQNYYLWRMNADNSSHTILADRQSEEPHWSPNGDKIVYSGIGDNFFIHSGLYIINRDGTLEQQLVAGDAYDPMWRMQHFKGPLVLVHGWQGFADGYRCSSGVTRYDGANSTLGDLPKMFASEGYDVWIAHLDSGPDGTPSLIENANCLKDQIETVYQTTNQKAILVSHSMGGLVSRACLSTETCRSSVKKLYTLGTPHTGFNSANNPFTKLYCFIKHDQAVCDMRASQMNGVNNFNNTNPNQKDINYTFIGGYQSGTSPLGWLLNKTDGANDGLVGRVSGVGWEYGNISALLAWLRPNYPAQYWTNETHISNWGDAYYNYRDGQDSHAFNCILALENSQTPPDECQPASISDTRVNEHITSLQSTHAYAGHISIGHSFTLPLTIDTTNQSTFYLIGTSGTLTFTLTQPDGQMTTPVYANMNPDRAAYAETLGNTEFPPTISYHFTNTISGTWTLNITATDISTNGIDYLTYATLETSRVLTVSTDNVIYGFGDTAVISATLQNGSEGISGANIIATAHRSDNITDTIPLIDRGNGIYTNTYTIPNVPGYLPVFVIATNIGGDANLNDSSRQSDILISISPDDAKLNGTYADSPQDGDGNGLYEKLNIDADITVAQSGNFLLSGDLFSNSQFIGHAAINTFLTAGSHSLTLSFLGDDIRAERINGPYSLTNVILVDSLYGNIPIDSAKDVWTTATYKWEDFGSYWQIHLPIVLK